MFNYRDVKITFCFAEINNLAVITIKTIKYTRAQFCGKYLFKTNLFDNFSWRFQNGFKLTLW